MFKQKEIVLIPFPYTDLTGNKLRPALIVSNDKLNKTNDRLCVLVTSNKSDNSIKISKKDQVKGKLVFESFVKPHRLFTIDKKIIKKSLCTISSDFHNLTISKINELLK